MLYLARRPSINGGRACNGGGRLLEVRKLATTLLGLGGLAAVYAFLIEPHWVDWHEEEVWLPGLPKALDGMRVCQISDIHVGSATRLWFLRRIFFHCTRQKPDLIVVTGDLVNHRARQIAPVIQLLSQLKARWGVLTIFGGHDYRDSPEVLAKRLGETPVRLLRNSAIAVGPEGSQIWVAGLDDNSGHGKPDINVALRDVPPGAPVLLLMHSPDSIKKVAAAGVPLVLAGHTHGGQVCLPFYGALRTMSRYGRTYARGRHQVKNTILYVNRGLGSHFHIRFLARPEITQFTLRAGE